ncbi:MULTISPECIES: hypothetical protein [unclassified Vibrio]|uniref:hypothetical protein n=1 Tax=unclassified Vibrio TaxID=2614977 RepID=UPI001361BDE1|nr:MULTISPECIES: hypothetical protein [unclassified Vibrio]NAW57304.1 hypothetical protein [Vibrio sp. V36_P2S2PM302]NAX25278.1 hypothetical protein [Vibrio sp. V38_P2S17PM301]NAX29744.1 hypothetical protein [Vibrio sp. V37_P2S8PM304]
MIQEKQLTFLDEVSLVFNVLNDGDFLPALQFVLALNDTLLASDFDSVDVYRLMMQYSPRLSKQSAARLSSL